MDTEDIKFILKEAVEEKIITEKQSKFYLLKYKKQELSIPDILKDINNFKHGFFKYKKIEEEYDIKSLIARGGMGEIYLAVNKNTEEKVALKKVIIPYDLNSQEKEKIKKRFLRECSLQSSLKHPNIVGIHKYGILEDDIFLIQDFIEGKTLQDIVSEEIIDKSNYFSHKLKIYLSLMKDICSAVSYAHGKGVIHRDINPRNIMIDKENKAWIMDFGLAKRFDMEMTRITKSNEVIGTPSYMAPEQWYGATLGPYTDIYSMGATLYYIITGFPPYPEQLLAIYQNIMNKTPPVSIFIYYKKATPDLIELINKSMAFEIKNRYENIEILKEKLEFFLEGNKIYKNITKKIKKFFT